MKYSLCRPKAIPARHINKLNFMQIPIKFNITKDYHESNFIVADCNSNAYKAINNHYNWTNNRLLIVGESGAGKTHLAQIWKSKVNAQPHNVFVLENIHNIKDEHEIVKIINTANESNTPLLMTSQTDLTPSLPDLASRLNATQTVYIERPNEKLLNVIINKEFIDRQWKVSPQTISYIIKHAKRNFSYIQKLIDALDKESIASKEKINIPLVKRLLKNI